MEIPALTDFVTDTRRCTTLGRDGQTVSTVEHLLAAFMLAGIDHARIVVDGPELPILDGAAQQWYEAINEAGVCTLEGEKPHGCHIQEPCWINDGQSEFFLTPSQQFSLYSAITIPEAIVTSMIAGGVVEQPEIVTQIVRARTYGLEREVKALRDSGLALGGSLENALVLTETGYLNEHVWPNEPAWHKVLDLLGDLALVGAHLHGQILAIRGGHRSHVALASRLRKMMLVS